jgi:dynein assembly factor 2
MTQDEVSMIGKAMKRKKFRGLMQEYVDEVSDPANREEYDKYLSELEAKREIPKGMELLRPEVGMCVQTSLRFPSGQKQRLYINLCHSPYLAEIGMKPTEAGQNVELPFTMGAPRPDKDDDGDTCLTIDFCVHTLTLARCVEQPQLLKVMVDIAAENLTQNFLKGKEEVMKDFTVTDLKCKGGTPYPMSVKEGTIKKDPSKKARDLPAPDGGVVTPAELRQMKKDARKAMGKPEEGPVVEEEVESEDDEPQEVAPERIRVPKHKLLHVGSVDVSQFIDTNTTGGKTPLYREIPKELKLIVELPTVKHVGDCELDVAADNVVLEVAEKFYLDLPLPYEIDAAKAKAKFDKHRTPAELQIVMPVVPKQIPQEEPSMPWEAVDEQDRLDNLEEEELPELVDEEPPAETPEAETPEPAAPSKPASAAAMKAERRERPNVRHERLDAPGDLEEATSPATPAPTLPLVQDAEDLAEGVDFVAASAYQGSRPGMVFKTGDKGLGYYRDVPFQPPPRPAPPKKEEFLVPREAKVVRTAESKAPKQPAPEAVDMGEPTVVAERENAARVWVAFAPEGDVADVHVALRPNQVRVSWIATVDGEQHAYEWRRVIKHDIDTREVHWEWTGRGQKEILVLLRKDGVGVWGEDIFAPIAAGAAADEEWPEQEENAPEGELAKSADAAEEDIPAPAAEPEVPAALAGDALLGMAVPLETRLFVEIL